MQPIYRSRRFVLTLLAPIVFGAVLTTTPSSAQENSRVFIPIAWGGRGVAECPIDGNAQQLIEEQVFDAARDAVWSANSAESRHRGFALSLIGVDAAFMGAVTLMEPCTTVQSYDHYCEAGGEEGDGFWSEHDRCLRLGCSAAGIGFADVYAVKPPHERPEDRHPLAYTSLAPAGEIDYDRNPLRRWTYDVRDTERIVVTGTLEGKLSFAVAGAEPIDLSHTGSVTVTREGPQLSALGLQLEYPSLSDRPIRLDLHMDQGHLDAGEVLYGDLPIAAIEGIFAPDIPPTFRWFAACGTATAP